ncbi:LysM peptidoglycan-binding domain-containing protein [Rhodoferax sp. U11-2br]|uniref:LysM peptidoglycan-binding domain-containing protein n=1 Tax=Rhodoferax sp. U11-2br TaxID=2838878 RepID=UPI001BE9D65C|nr:LysM peptidoglycan-binding domain-containing protein [Rhodoferax sp. U11-2br]MBT3068960.1 LysM peptidoglycan-binding domain-containing protein [Rhodoferax sp. U11-2br]
MPHTFLRAALTPLACVTLAFGWLAAGAAQAQNFPVSAQQRATANQVAQAGVALTELRSDAPQSYTIQSGDTLWSISGLFLTSPWRWPELWGMNMADIRNPHLIYPGQTLYLVTANGRARLSTQANIDGGIPTVRLSPRTRIEGVADNALPTLQNHLIEPFLSEGIVVDDQTMNQAPRIVATQDGRVFLTRGDRAYVRSSSGDLMDDPTQKQKAYRIFRDTKPLKDPVTGEVLGFEAPYLGKALLARSEGTQTSAPSAVDAPSEVIPATFDIVDVKEEIRVGDRLLPEPPRQLLNYVPHAPASPVDARIVSIYGTAVVNAAQNQVVILNKGSLDGLENGHVLAILQSGARIVDKTDPALANIKLPDERNGLLMVFRTFDKLSYGLVLDIVSGVKVGDRLVNPR